MSFRKFGGAIFCKQLEMILRVFVDQNRGLFVIYFNKLLLLTNFVGPAYIY